MKTQDYLSEDIPLPGQVWALVSIIGPHMKQKCDVWGLKIKGTAATEEEADNMAKKLQKLDKHIDIFRVPVGKFFPLNINPGSADNVVYQNEQLNDLMKEHKKNRIEADSHFNERKSEMMEKASSSKSNSVEIINKADSLRKQINNLIKDLKDTNKLFKELSEQEQQEALSEFEKVTSVKYNPNFKLLDTINEEQDGHDGHDGHDGQDGQDGQDGHDGQDGQDGQDGHDGHDEQETVSLDIEAITNELNDINITLQETPETPELLARQFKLKSLLSTNTKAVNEYISTKFKNPSSFGLEEQ